MGLGNMQRAAHLDAFALWMAGWLVGLAHAHANANAIEHG